MKIWVENRNGVFPQPVTVLEVFQELIPERQEICLGAFEGGRVLELCSMISKDTVLQPITYAQEEGRRIYERSLRFVFLLAVNRLFPDIQIIIQHSIGPGIYVEFEQMRLQLADLAAIEQEMRYIISSDLSFHRHKWSREKAIEYFRNKGDFDKANLLSYRPYDYFTIYELDGLYEYFYGAMLPSTGYTSVFDMRLHAPGLVALMPSAQNPNLPAEYISLPKHMATHRQSNYWCKELNCSTVAELNALTASGGMRDFIRVNEALHNNSLSDIAQDIFNRNARAIFIAGPSSSGKTTFANRLAIQLRVSGLNPIIISLDDFYIDRDILPLETNGQPDLEALSALDVDYFQTCLGLLLNGQTAMMPRFNFHHKKREIELVPMSIAPDQPLIIEGIHGLNPALHDNFDRKLICLVYISQLTSINLDKHNRIRTTDARLLRRIVRDSQFRGTQPSATLAMWDSVRRGEENWIFPFQEEADIVFNSALHYELPVFRAIAYDMLRKVPKDDPNYVKCNRILKILNYMLPIDPSLINEIPPLSILREFIGGNTLYLPQDPME
ncbi:MAG: nucleoside kinase [Clostridiales bacterium]|nr:nucleoside kinase [Clostridiales bacterium]